MGPQSLAESNSERLNQLKPSACADAVFGLRLVTSNPEATNMIRTDLKLQARLLDLMKRAGLTVEDVNRMTRDGLPLFTEPTEEAPKQGTSTDDYFQINGSTTKINVSDVRELIRAKLIRFTVEKRPLQGIGPALYGLDKDLGWEQTPTKPVVEIDRAFAQTLTADQLDQPGIIIVVEGQELIIDGNDRVARKYMDGEESMRFYIFHEEELLGLQDVES